MFESLARMGRYATVVVDCPWPTKGAHGKNAPGYYHRGDLLSIADLRELPIPDILAEDAWVFMWTFQSHFKDAFALLESWGVEFKFLMVWHKEDGFQPSQRPRYNGEFLLVGSKGRPKFIETKDFRTVNMWPRGEHSQKPDASYELIARVCEEPRLDIFARQAHAGFDCWGNEAPGARPEPDAPEPVESVDAPEQVESTECNGKACRWEPAGEGGTAALRCVVCQRVHHIIDLVPPPASDPAPVEDELVRRALDAEGVTGTPPDGAPEPKPHTKEEQNGNLLDQPDPRPARRSRKLRVAR